MEVRLGHRFLSRNGVHLRMCRSTVYMSTKDGVLELVQNAVRLNLDDELLIIIDDVGERLELQNVRIKEVNLISSNIVLEKKE